MYMMLTRFNYTHYLQHFEGVYGQKVLISIYISKSIQLIKFLTYHPSLLFLAHILIYGKPTRGSSAPLVVPWFLGVRKNGLEKNIFPLCYNFMHL